jgi:DNA replication initiation complex subunit (GINS family)
MSESDAVKETSITFHDLGEVHSSERGSTSLTRLPDQFYERSATYLKSLLTRMENCTSGGTKEPDEAYMRISEEYRRSKDILERIYSTRERKIVLSALNSSRGIIQSTEEMIRDEEDLYYQLKMQFEDVRERVLKYDRMHKKPRIIRAETGINTSTDDFTDEEETGPTNAPMLDSTLAKLKRKGQDVENSQSGNLIHSEVPEPETGNETEGPPLDEASSQDLLIVRALKEVGPFVGPDKRTVKLAKEDVISLSGQVARILLEGGMVEEL